MKLNPIVKTSTSPTAVPRGYNLDVILFFMVMATVMTMLNTTCNPPPKPARIYGDWEYHFTGLFGNIDRRLEFYEDGTYFYYNSQGSDNQWHSNYDPATTYRFYKTDDSIFLEKIYYMDTMSYKGFKLSDLTPDDMTIRFPDGSFDFVYRRVD